MENEPLIKIESHLKTIKNDLPCADLSLIEETLKKILQVQEKQLELSKRIIEKLDDVYNEIPSSPSGLHGIDKKLGQISNLMDDVKNILDDISNNTSYIGR